MRTMRVAVVILAVLAALACSGTTSLEGVGSEETEAVDVRAAPAVAPAPADVAPSRAAAETFAADADGVCRLQDSCGCSQESYEACISGVGTLPHSVLSCIASQDCATLCAGGGVRCIEGWAAEESAASRAAHETQMEILRNMPSGGACPGGTSEVRDANGSFLGCR